MSGSRPRRSASSSVGVAGRVRLRVWDVDELEEYIPQYSRRRRERRHALLSAALPVEPEREVVVENMVLDNYLEMLARGANEHPDYLALGDGTTAPDPANDSLNNEVYRTPTGQNEVTGSDRLTSTLISQNEANGEAIREVGLTTDARERSWTQLTHVVLDSADQIEEKNSKMALTIDYILEFRRL